MFVLNVLLVLHRITIKQFQRQLQMRVYFIHRWLHKINTFGSTRQRVYTPSGSPICKVCWWLWFYCGTIVQRLSCVLQYFRHGTFTISLSLSLYLSLFDTVYFTRIGSLEETAGQGAEVTPGPYYSFTMCARHVDF